MDELNFVASRARPVDLHCTILRTYALSTYPVEAAATHCKHKHYYRDTATLQTLSDNVFLVILFNVYLTTLPDRLIPLFAYFSDYDNVERNITHLRAAEKTFTTALLRTTLVTSCTKILRPY